MDRRNDAVLVFLPSLPVLAERPAVIVTDLRLVEDRRDVRMYIALTRAMLTVRVVAPREVLEAEPILSRLL